MKSELFVPKNAPKFALIVLHICSRFAPKLLLIVLQSCSQNAPCVAPIFAPPPLLHICSRGLLGENILRAFAQSLAPY